MELFESKLIWITRFQIKQLAMFLRRHDILRALEPKLTTIWAEFGRGLFFTVRATVRAFTLRGLGA